MGLKKTKVNFRVEVTPRAPGDFGICFISGQTRTEEETRSICIDLIQQIRRHVDGIDSAVLVFDVERTCEHCGWQWTEGDDSPHNGGCCAKDCDVMDSLQESAEPTQ
jgi:hypothetical protein